MNIVLDGLFNGLSYGMLLFVLACGFSLIFGLMAVLNFAHGSMFSWGGMIGYFVGLWTGNFWLGLLGGALGVAIIGLFVDRALIAPLKGNPISQLILTFGLIYIFQNVSKLVFGDRPYVQLPPEWLQGSFKMFGSSFSIYRLFIIVVGLIIFIVMWVLLYKTKLGMIIRAGTEKPDMVRASGINIKKIFIITFVLGCALAGFGGAVAVPYLGAYATVGDSLFFNAMAIVVIGGIGDFKGSFYASLVVGVLNWLVQYFFPNLAMATVIVFMLVVIIFKPQGLFGGKTNG